MDEQALIVAIAEASAAPKPFKDRSTALIVWGVLTILLGCVTGLMIPILIFGHEAAAKQSTDPSSFAAIFPAVFICGASALTLVWLGVGSAMARRWARALLLIYSWSWLVLGLIAFSFMVFFGPDLLERQRSGGTSELSRCSTACLHTVMIALAALFGFFLVALPTIWTLFYGSRHVKATCEARDPVPRWTEACPLPVLAFCLWSALFVPLILVLPFTNHGVMQVFGTIISGIAGTTYCLAIAACSIYAIWYLYKLEWRGWLVALISACAQAISELLNSVPHDLTEMYRLMNYSEAQIEQAQHSFIMVGNRRLWLTVFLLATNLGCLLLIKRYIRRKS